MIRPIDFTEMKRLISVRHALEQTGWSPVWVRGDLCRGPCPVHGSHDPSSRVLAVTSTAWYCHRCHAGGDVIRLWERLHGMTAVEAALDLCARFHLRVPRR